MHFFPRKPVSPRPLGLAPSRLKRVIESPLLSPQKRRRCKAWAVLRFFLFLFLPSVAPCTNRQKVREKKKEGLSAGSKRAMHSLHHHDVTRPSRPRQVVSCSSRSDGSKKRTEPTKEVKSLICQTKQGGFLFSYSSLSSFFSASSSSSSSSLPARNLFTFLDATLLTSQDTIPRNPRATVSQRGFEPEQTTLQSRVTSSDLRPSGYAIFPIFPRIVAASKRTRKKGDPRKNSEAPRRRKTFTKFGKVGGKLWFRTRKGNLTCNRYARISLNFDVS